LRAQRESNSPGRAKPSTSGNWETSSTLKTASGKILRRNELEDACKPPPLGPSLAKATPPNPTPLQPSPTHARRPLHLPRPVRRRAGRGHAAANAVRGGARRLAGSRQSAGLGAAAGGKYGQCAGLADQLAAGPGRRALSACSLGSGQRGAAGTRVGAWSDVLA